jgi:hypothetical protein
MKSIVPHKWEMDREVNKLTSLILLRYGVCKDIRIYIRDFLYEYKCESDNVFYRIKKWKDEEIDLYERVQMNRETVASVDNITYVLLGLIYTYMYFGKHVVFLSEKDYNIYIVNYLVKIINQIYIRCVWMDRIVFKNNASFTIIPDISCINRDYIYYKSVDLLIVESGMEFDGIKYNCLLTIETSQMQVDWYYDEFLKNIY